MVKCLAKLVLVWYYSSSCPRSFLPYFLLFSCHYYRVRFFLLLHPLCSHARGILCRIHTPCMGSPFHAVHTKWSLVSFATSSPRLKTALSLVYCNNNDRYSPKCLFSILYPSLFIISYACFISSIVLAMIPLQGTKLSNIECRLSLCHVGPR